MKKIIAGLIEALRHARGDCRHEFTYWEPNDMPGCEKMKAWNRVCTKCRVRETMFRETEPSNN